MKTGFQALDECIGDFRKEELIVIGSQPGVGKTTLFMNILKNNPFDLRNTVLFVPKNGKEEYVSKILATFSDISPLRMNSGNVTDAEWVRLTKGASFVSESGLLIDDSTESVSEVVEKCRLYAEDRKVRFILIDSQFVSFDMQPYSIAAVVSQLKELATLLSAAIVWTCEVSREGLHVEGRQSVRSCRTWWEDDIQMLDPADVVMILSREHVAALYSSIHKKAEISIIKNYFGPTGAVDLSWNPELLQYRESVRRL